MDTLAFWMYSADGSINSINFGPAPRRSSADVSFRLFNASTVYTANEVLVTVEGTRGFTYYLSTDGESFAGSIDLGDMAPGTYTGELTLRRVTPSDAPLGAETVTVVATAATWT